MSMLEEINRRVTNHVSSLLFTPTKTRLKNLRRERVPCVAYLVGEIHVYILRNWLPIAEEKSNVLGRLAMRSHGYIVNHSL
jgi:UDP-GlcNAc3NAcA epimerase